MASSPPEFSAYPSSDCLAHRAGIDAALKGMLDSGWYILGREVEAFEREFAAWVGTRHAIGVANGTDAIEVLLRGLGLGAGDVVLVPTHTAVASASGVARAGAVPLLVDVDPVSCTMCLESVARAFASSHGPRIRAVLAVHLYGHPCAMEELRALCDAHGAILLEDCAQAHGATLGGRKAGALARGASFSFYPTKNLGAIGDGGAITTDDDALAERLKEVRQYGWRQRYISAIEGVNSRLDEMQAAILRVKLQSLDAQNAARQRLAARYDEGLREVAWARPPAVRAGCGHAYHLYVIQSKQREALMKHLLGAGVPVALHYPAAIHQQPGYARYASPEVPLRQAEALMREILTLPLHPYLSDEAVAYTLAGIRQFRP